MLTPLRAVDTAANQDTNDKTAIIDKEIIFMTFQIQLYPLPFYRNFCINIFYLTSKKIQNIKVDFYTTLLILNA
jgi:hypothetical protein